MSNLPEQANHLLPPREGYFVETAPNGDPCYIPNEIYVNDYHHQWNDSIVYTLQPNGAAIAASASVRAETTLGPRVIVDDGVRMFEDSVVGAGARIGPNSRIYDNVTIGSNANLLGKVFVHSRSSIGANAVIGSKSSVKHGASVGRHVRIGDRCEIGHGTSIGDGSIILPRIIIRAAIKVSAGTRITQNDAEKRHPSDDRYYYRSV